MIVIAFNVLKEYNIVAALQE